MLIDTKHTKAILIGVSEFQDKEHFINAPPIKNNIPKIKSLLRDSKILGLPDENILVFDKNESSDDILNGIDDFMDSGFSDTIIFYFAGHGYKTRNNHFYMVTNNTKRKRIATSSIPWEEIKNTFERENTDIQQRFYIIDACHSGAATLSDDSSVLEVEKGSVLLAAASEEEKAYFDKNEKYTDFTKALIETVQNGADNTEIEAFDVNLLHENICSLLKSYGNRFNTKIKKTDKIEKVFFFKNKRYDIEINDRNEIQENINWAKELIEDKKYKRAKTLLQKAEADTSQLKNKKTLPKQIEKFLNDCIYLPIYTPRIEKEIRLKLDNEIKEYKEKITVFEDELSVLQEQINKKEAEVSTLKEKVLSDKELLNITTYEKKEIERQFTALTKELTQEKNKSKSVNKQIEEFNVSIKSLTKKIQQLNKDKEKLHKKISELSKAQESIITENQPIIKTNINSATFEMVFVKGGTFSMGAGDKEKDADEDEKPRHDVKLSDFNMAKITVTQRLWKEVMRENTSYFKGDDLPVEEVTWYDAVEFCNKLSEKDGKKPFYRIDKNTKDAGNKNTDDVLKWRVEIKQGANGYRLPTEAEWEYAARGGELSKAYNYAGGNKLTDVAWHDKNSGDKTHLVGTKEPNELGLFDLTGNVWEWCWDWFDGKYYEKCEKEGIVEDPHGPASGSGRVVRGGSWFHEAQYCRVASRLNDIPGYRDFSGGFRLVFVP